VLTENNREVNVSTGRLSHSSMDRIELEQGREKAVETLKQVAKRREDLSRQVNVRE
jgi:hypothetical protein